MDAHSPYEPKTEHNRWGDEELLSIQEHAPNIWELFSQPESWWKRSATESLYDGTIRQLDAQLKRLVECLEERGELEETLLVITSDHGEGFGEPSRVRPNDCIFGHNTALHECILHVPLLVRFPGQDSGRRIDRLASTTKFPTVVEAALDGEVTPEAFLTSSSFATSYGLLVDEQLRSRAERYQDLDTFEGFSDRLRAVYEDDDGTIRKHLAWGDRRAITVRIHDAQTAYVEAEIDPSEVDARFDGLCDTSLVEEAAGIDSVDQATQQRLEDLGYM